MVGEDIIWGKKLLTTFCLFMYCSGVLLSLIAADSIYMESIFVIGYQLGPPESESRSWHG